jgi:hypothetical protein
MQQLTTNSTPEEIQNASQSIIDMIALKDDYIRTLESRCDLTDKLLRVKDQTIANRDEYIKELKTKIDELMVLLNRAIEVTNKNI